MGFSYELAASLTLAFLIAVGLIHSRLATTKTGWGNPGVVAVVAVSIFILGGIYQPNKVFAIFLAFMLINLAAPTWRIDRRAISAISFTVLAVIVASLMLSIYEVLSDTAWAGYKSSSGVNIRRPSAFFYNPNVFGFWVAFLGVRFSALYFFTDERGVAAAGGVLCSLCALLASSRGYGYLFIFAVVCVSVLNYRRGWMSARCVMFAVIPFLIGSLVLVLVSVYFLSPKAETFAGLALRLLATPYETIIHVLGPVFVDTHATTTHVTDEFRRSFAGRFEGRALDSGIKAMVINLSGVSLAGFVLFYAACFLRVWRCFRSRVVPFCLMTLFFILSGLFMSYAVLPLWLSWAVVVAMFQYVEIDEEEAPQ